MHSRHAYRLRAMHWLLIGILGSICTLTYAQTTPMAETAEDFIKGLGGSATSSSSRSAFTLRGLGGVTNDANTSANSAASQTRPSTSHTNAASTAAQSSPPATGQKVSALIHFDTNSATLKPDAHRILDELTKALQTQLSDIELMIVGHTDSRGSADYNLSLSKQRAQSVKDYLTARGIQSRRLRVSGEGEAQPIASNATAEGRRLNRRSEFIRLGS